MYGQLQSSSSPNVPHTSAVNKSIMGQMYGEKNTLREKTKSSLLSMEGYKPLTLTFPSKPLNMRQDFINKSALINQVSGNLNYCNEKTANTTE